MTNWQRNVFNTVLNVLSAVIGVLLGTNLPF